jgi:hypothetical protein
MLKWERWEKDFSPPRPEGTKIFWPQREKSEPRINADGHGLFQSKK